MEDGQNAYVLVADDDREMCDVVRAILDQAGFRTVVARDGDEAVAIAAARQPACIVMDVLMPRMDGYTALTRLRGDARTRAIPVVMLTAQPEPIYRTLSAGLGAVAHLTKPFTGRQLTQLVAAATRQALAGGAVGKGDGPDAGLTPASADH